MRRILAKKLGYPLKDIYSKAPNLKTKAFLDETQYWDEKRMEEYRINKLKSLVRHAYENVPYYTELFDRIGLKPDDILTIEDIKKIPVLTKSEARENRERLLSKDIEQRVYFEVKTGGTTGPPLRILKDVDSYAFEWGSFYRWFDWIGVDIGDPIITFWGAPTVLSVNVKKKIIKFITNYLTNQYYFNSFELSEKTLPKVIKRLNRYKPKLIKGYLSAILQIATYLNKHNLKLKFQPTAISTTSETLLPNQRKIIEEAFGCSVFDQYGCTEVTAVSYECKEHLGMHITQEHVIVEVLADDNSENFLTGKLILTDLDCYVMPIIRYENGDTVSLSEGLCKCGVQLPLIQSIDGRVSQTIELKDGRNVHGVFFTDVLYELPRQGEDIIKFQVFQCKSGEIEFRYESFKELSKEYLAQLEQSLSRFFDKVQLIRYDKIPASISGKHSYLLRER